MLNTTKKKINNISIYFVALLLGFCVPILFILAIFFLLTDNASDSSAVAIENVLAKNVQNNNALNENLSFELESFLKPISFPILKTDTLVPTLSAKSAIVIDFNTSRIFFKKNPQLKLQIGSLTKLMAALVILDNIDLQTIIQLTQDDVAYKGSFLRFYAGERYSVETLLKFALIESNNNAIYAIAHHFGIENFVEKMNETAKRLKMDNTHFQNPIGLDDEKNYSTAEDLATLLHFISNQPVIKKILSIKEIELSSLAQRKILIKNTNQLIDNPDIVFGKTGTTQKALQNYAAIIKVPDNRELILVVLNSQNRYADTENLISYLKDGFIWQ